MKNKKLYVRDVMTRDVITVPPDMLIQAFAKFIVGKKVSGVPVVKGGKLAGIVTLTDLFKVLEELLMLSAIEILEQQNVAITVGEIMTADVITVSPDVEVNSVVPLSVSKNIHTLPVVEDGKLVGVIGKTDILRAGFSILCDRGQIKCIE